MKMQTDNIASRYDIDDINVVVGFKKDLIMERFPELTYVYNPFFELLKLCKLLAFLFEDIIFTVDIELKATPVNIQIPVLDVGLLFKPIAFNLACGFVKASGLWQPHLHTNTHTH